MDINGGQLPLTQLTTNGFCSFENLISTPKFGESVGAVGVSQEVNRKQRRGARRSGTQLSVDRWEMKALVVTICL